MHLKLLATTLGQTPGPNLQFQLVKIMHGIVCALDTYSLHSFLLLPVTGNDKKEWSMEDILSVNERS
jgi:hypothetical protein